MARPNRCKVCLEAIEAYKQYCPECQKMVEEDEAKMKKNLKIRTCLRCGQGFKSYGPQNRICDYCVSLLKASWLW